MSEKSSFIEHGNDDAKEKLNSTTVAGVVTLQEAYQIIGGFKYFQYYTSVLFIVGFNTGAFLFYTLSLLELQPRYLCYPAEGGEPYDCKPEQFCGTDIKYEVDWTYYASLHNWIEDLDMACTSKSKIGLIGSMYFAGYCVSAIILPRLSDIYGRKIIYFISMVGHLLAYLVMIISTSLNLNIAMMVFFGFFSLGRASVGYIYMQEFTPTKQQTIVGTILQVFNGMVVILSCIYFYFISKYWRGFQIFGWSLNLLVVLGIFLLPESPKFLIGKKRFDEARVSLRKIAKFNRYKGEINFKFDTEEPNTKSLLAPSQNQKEIQVQDTSLTLSPEQRRIQKDQEDEQQLTGSLKDLIKIRKHLINLVLLAFIWMASAFNYYLINFQMKYLNGNIFVNTSTASLSEMCAYIIAGISYQHIGIRFTLITAFAISCIGAICLAIWDSAIDFVPYMILATRFGVSATFNICYLANAQLFPAIFAGTAIGICNIFAKMATIIAPELAEVQKPIPMTVFAVITGIASVIAFFIITDKKVKN